MSYESIADLPKHIRRDMPEEAQELYKKVFNRSWNNYDDDKGGDLGREGVAVRDAMNAVRQEFEQDEDTGTWHRIDEQDEASRSLAELKTGLEAAE